MRQVAEAVLALATWSAGFTADVSDVYETGSTIQRKPLESFTAEEKTGSRIHTGAWFNLAG